jgi:AAA domain
MAAKRISLIDDPKMQALLWWIQWRSLQPRGVRQLADEIIARFPDRFTTAEMRKVGPVSAKRLSRDQILKLRGRVPGCFPLRGEVEEVWSDDRWFDDSSRPERRVLKDAPTHYSLEDFSVALRNDAATELPEHLKQLCVNPELRDEKMEVSYFDELIGALAQLRSECGTAATSLADTEATRSINSTLDFCFRRRRMVLIEGKAGIGKSETVKAWCNRRAGMARYVEVPAGADERSFFATIAASIGVARGGSYNGQQIKLRVEDALRASGLMLVLDEAHFLWPQYSRPQGIPSRIQWIKTLFDSGVPIALIALPKFSEWQKLYARKTIWDEDQLERRLNRKVALPDAHSKQDLMKIARAKHSNGDKLSWELLTGYALAATKKQASAISEAMESAIDIAEQNGRAEVSYDDIEAAIRLDFRPAELPVKPATKPRVAAALQLRCSDRSKPLQIGSRFAAAETVAT